MEGRFDYPLEGPIKEGPTDFISRPPFDGGGGNLASPSFPEDEIMNRIKYEAEEMGREFLMEKIPEMRAKRRLKNEKNEKKQDIRKTLHRLGTVSRNGTSIAYNENNKKEILMTNDKPWGDLPDDPNARGADGYMDSIVQNAIEEEERRKKEQENKK